MKNTGTKTQPCPACGNQLKVPTELFDAIKKMREHNQSFIPVIQKDILFSLGLDLDSIIHNLEYASFNLCEKSDDDIELGITDSTCPETSLFIAIRKLNEIKDKVKQ